VRFSLAWASLVGVIGPTLIGAVLALWGLGTESLWLDEATSLDLARMSPPAFWRQVTGPEINAIAYYLALRGWVTFGTGEAWIRLLSALFAIATIPVVWMLGLRLFGEPRARIAALVLAANPFFIQFAQEARGYSLAMLLSAASTLAFVLALERSTFKRWVAWAVLAGVGLYAHLFTAFAIAGQLLVAGTTASVDHGLRARLRPLASSTAAVALMAVPIVVVVATSGREHLAHIPAPTPFHIVRTGYFVTGGYPPLTIFIGLLTVAAAAATARAWRRQELTRPAELGSLLVWVWLLVPPVMSLAISLVKPIFYARYLIVMLPAIAFVVAIGVASLRPARLAGAAVAIVAAVSLVGVMVQAATLSKEDWRGAATVVLERAEPGDGIAFVSASVAKPFAYYVARSGRAHAAPTPIWPEVEWLAADPLVRIPDLAVTQDRIARRDRVWLVVSHEDRSLDDLESIESALAAAHVEREVIRLHRVEIRLWSHQGDVRDRNPVRPARRRRRLRSCSWQHPA
jgi:mannosyltransferase